MKDIINVNVVDEMKQAYGDYALAVIVGRAIPDLYDGLKPVQRRILTAMSWLNLKPTGRFMKSARVEGETMGKLHPQGGAYGAIVNMAQWWTNNAILVDGHGNFGSPTDGPAAARYTEAKLTEYAYSVMLGDQSTWETRPNYDGSLQEPIRLNTKIPNVLINGSDGIAVGMATRIPMHNLRGVAKALRFLAEDDLAAANKQLIPDFASGCEIVKDEGLLDYVNTGHGSIRMRAKCEQSEIDHGKRAKRNAFTFTNLPLHVNTEQVGDQIKDAVAKDKITTVADVRDETDRTGIRLVVILKASANPELAKKELYRWTSLDTKFSANNTVIDGVSPVDLAPLEILTRWMKWRDGCFVASLTEELGGHRSRLEIVQGLIGALGMIDDIIDEIKQASNRADARARIMKREFTEVQANSILDMRLAQLTKLDATTLKDEMKELQARIKALIKLNSNKNLREEALLEEIDDIATRHGNARRSKLIDTPDELDTRAVKQGQSKVSVSRPRFVKVDEKLGILTQLKKIARGAIVVESTDKMLFMCDNGKTYRVAATAKGPLAEEPTQVLYKTRLSSMSDIPIIAVWKLDDGVYANVMPLETLSKCTSKGKRWLPEGAELIHLGGTYTLEKEGRKKDVQVAIDSIKPRPIGGKGNKIAKLNDVVLA